MGCGRRGTRTPEPEWERIYSPLQLPLCDPPKNYLLITCIWVVSGIRTHINMLHRHAPKPLGHHYHILSGMGESDSHPQHGKLV